MIDRDAASKQYDFPGRLTPTALQTLVWNSKLCSDHKLLMLALTGYMRFDWPVAYPGGDLQARASMSRSKTSRLMQSLLAHNWIVMLPHAGLLEPRPGRPPRVYVTPRLTLDLSIPDHCSQRKDRTKNLARTQ